VTIKRREFITLLGGAAAWPVAARGQQSDRARRVGILGASAEGNSLAQAGLAAFKEALQKFGWTDGRNIRIEARWGALDAVRTQVFAKELSVLQPDLILASTTPAAVVLQRETRTIPIVFVAVSDPVGSGLVTSLPRPGGNITGFTNFEDAVSGIWIEILRDIVPRINRAVLAFNPDTATYFNYYLRPFEAAARSSSIEPVAAPIRTTEQLERVVANVGGTANAALAIMPDVFMSSHHDLIVSLAARFRVPTIYPYPYYVEAGGLISYGIEQTDLYRRAATYADRILKGAKPAELPVQLPTKSVLAVNLKTAQALGLNLSREFLLIADKVIE
jgi:putative ABC transport system substrate-binding protein